METAPSSCSSFSFSLPLPWPFPWPAVNAGGGGRRTTQERATNWRAAETFTLPPDPRYVSTRHRASRRPFRPAASSEKRACGTLPDADYRDHRVHHVLPVAGLLDGLIAVEIERDGRLRRSQIKFPVESQIARGHVYGRTVPGGGGDHRCARRAA